MRRIAVIALFCAAALAGCSSASGGGGAPAGGAYVDPASMKSKLSGVVSLSECTAPTRDVDGVMFTQCVDGTGGLVRLSTVDVGEEESKGAALSGSGWKVTTGPGWIAAVNSDQATLEKVKAALS